MKIRRIREFKVRFSFADLDSDFESYRSAFLDSDLSKIYRAVPWRELVEALGLRESRKGPACIFPPRGKVGLMFLKHYACCSDRKLSGSFHFV
jgi:hypothetical protein